MNIILFVFNEFYFVFYVFKLKVILYQGYLYQ